MEMRELLKEHIRIIFIESTCDNEIINKYLTYLKNHKHLTLLDISTDIKEKGVYTLPIITSDMAINILVSGYYDYSALFDSMSVECIEVSPMHRESIENIYGFKLESVLKHLAIKVIFDESNPRLIAILDKELMKNSDESSDYNTFHSLNTPSVAYKGSVAFHKYAPESKKSVAKEWFLIKAKQVISHNAEYMDAWLAVKIITLRKDVKKTYFKVAPEPSEVVSWLATPLAMRDPSKPKMLFEIHAGVADYGDDKLLEALGDLGACENPIDNAINSAVASNAVNLSDLKASIAKSMDGTLGLHRDFDVIHNSEVIGTKGVNPYTVSHPRNILDRYQQNEALSFELGNFNHRVERNKVDAYSFEGWLIAYVNTKEDMPIKAYKSGTLRPIRKWLEVFVFKSADCYYMTKIQRNVSRRNRGVVNSSKYNDLESIIASKDLNDKVAELITSQLI